MATPPFQPRGAPTAFEKSVYSGISQTTYPDDLLSSPQYGGNFVVFYINVHERSKLLADQTKAVDPALVNATPSNRGFTSGQNYDSTAITVGAGAAGVAAARAVGVTDKMGLPVSKKVATGIDTFTGLAVGAAVAQAVGSSTAQYKRIKDAIALYVPNDLSTNYSVEWNVEELGGTNAFLSGLQGVTKAFQEATSGTDDAMKAAGNALVSGGSAVGSYLVGAALSSPGMGQALSKMSGIAGNPKQEQLFRKVNFREFQMRYQFFPKSQKEAENVRKIIKLFKYHMHPEYKDDAGFLYLYPSEFDIYYYKDGRENENLHRHTSCVLTSLNVEYTPQSQFNTFADGMPTAINITLNFKELALLSKEAIDDRY